MYVHILNSKGDYANILYSSHLNANKYCPFRLKKRDTNNCFSYAILDNFSFVLDFCKIDTPISTSHRFRFPETSMLMEYNFIQETTHNSSEI